MKVHANFVHQNEVQGKKQFQPYLILNFLRLQTLMQNKKGWDTKDIENQILG